MPCDYSKYPKDWKQISIRIRERAGHKCEWCKAPNGRSVLRGQGEHDGTYLIDNTMYCNKTGDVVRRIVLDSEYNYSRQTKIVLTVSHLNHNIADNRDENLAALCQRCHLRHDAAHHAANAKATRDRKRGQADMLAIDRTEAQG